MQIVVAGPEHLPIIQTLFREYEQELDADLCFQSFEAELADPFKKYGEPKGALFLAFDGTAAAGCIALQPLTEAGVCEMKRLYVRPAYRKTGLGRLLVTQLLETARIKQYHTMRLDTLEKLQPAIKLYASFGFREVGAYYDNPLEGVVYMEKGLGVSR
ncbi:MAG: GNAT family N-acetyltransferase [Chitinophagaceae bacterium]|nr:GNAT family N-acetyltransferase [Chitinophagaceae bacterium]